MERLRRYANVAWLLAILGFAALHAWHLRADFPNHSPWAFDWAKYTDEGWYGDAAIRAHLLGNWYLPGDFNPAVIFPVWPVVEWVLFFFTGVSVQAARGLAVACFFLNLWLSYLLLRSRRPEAPDLADRAGICGPRWMALLMVTLLVTSPFLWSFSRLAILEPLEITLTLTALNLAVRLKGMRRPLAASVAIGVIFALMTLTKLSALFLGLAVLWAMVQPLWSQRKLALRCALVGAGTAAAVYGAWMALVIGSGLLGDYKYFYIANQYMIPTQGDWQLPALLWSLHGLLWIDHSLVWMAGAIALAAAIAWRADWAKRLWRNPVFGASLWAVVGFVMFMTVRDHPQPRYFAVPAFFLYFVVALGLEALLAQAGWRRAMGWAACAAAAAAVGAHGAQTIRYAAHPQFTFVNAATQLAQYMDTHPNGKRLLVSISDDEIMLITRTPGICDELGTEDLAPKIAQYQPGWYASWNDLDPAILKDLHAHYSLEQVATYSAFDDPDRDLLVLFKLHPLPGGQERDPDDPAMGDVLPDDRIEVPIE